MALEYRATRRDKKNLPNYTMDAKAAKRESKPDKKLMLP